MPGRLELRQRSLQERLELVLSQQRPRSHIATYSCDGCSSGTWSLKTLKTLDAPVPVQHDNTGGCYISPTTLLHRTGGLLLEAPPRTLHCFKRCACG